MKDLLVGSTICEHPRTDRWLELQKHFLDKTVGADNYTHAVWVDHRYSLRKTRSPVWDAKTLLQIGYGADPGTSREEERCQGLGALLNYFTSCREYENYLVLDNDAFPVARGWLSKLVARMQTVGATWAAPVRGENLETFVHPSIGFIPGSWLRGIAGPPVRFERTSYYDLRGEMVDAVVLTDVEARFDAMPLIRTNVFNPHPILSGIYGGVFYHHGCGTSPLSLRAVEEGDTSTTTSRGTRT